MEISSIAKKAALVIVILLIGFTLQVMVCSNIKIASIAPNLMIILLTAFAFHLGSKYGMYIGFFSGLLMDLFSGYYLGVNALLFTFIGFATGFYSIVIMGNDIKSDLLIIAVNDFLYGLFYWVIHSISHQNFSFYYLKAIIVPEIVYTLVLAMVLYYPLLKVTAYLNKSNIRAGNRLEG